MRRWTNDSGAAGSYSSVFDAFGQVVSQSGSRPPYGFGADWAYRDDGDAGLLHIGARWYDPVVGRWITADKYLGDIFDPLSLNRYLYCKDDPVNHVDPDGYQQVRLPPNWTYNLAKAIADQNSDQVGTLITAITGDPEIGQVVEEVMETVNFKKGMKPTKKKAEKIGGLAKQIIGHAKKIVGEPDSPAVGHWRKEIGTWLTQIGEKLR